MTTQPTLSPIGQVLHRLLASGWTGFEGLVATLLQDICRQRILVSGSGLQSGLDLRTSLQSTLHIAVECKRYDRTTPLNERELVSEIEVATATNRMLDAWVLAATRPVTVQQEAALHEACRRHGIDYITLDCSSLPNVGTLDALCAAQSTRVLEFLAGAGVAADIERQFRDAVSTLAGRAEVDIRVSDLRARLEASSLGFSTFRDRLCAKLRTDLLDFQKCLRRFHCALTPSSDPPAVAAVPRPRIVERLQQSFDRAKASSDAAVVALIGEEGDGKSWVLADWIRALLASPEAPAIFFMPAREPFGLARDALAQHAVRFAGLADLETARPRVARWFGPGTSRRAIVVLDGLNERLDVRLWSDLIHTLVDDFGAAMYVVLTCRRHSWRAHYRSTLVTSIEEIDVGPFDDDEFAFALATVDAVRGEAIARLGPLVRKPRYFHCAATHVASLPEPYELTVPLLYYLDWRHRHSRRPTLSPNVEDFEMSLKSVARRLRNRRVPLGASDATFDEGHARDCLEELASGGVLRKARTGAWHVEPPFLALACGLYLAGLIEESGGSIEDRAELAWSTLGDTSGWDLSGDVLSHALRHALADPSGFGVETQVAILVVWSECLNALDSAVEAIKHLGPRHPVVLLGLAEAIWRRDGIDAAIETAVLHGLVQCLRTPSSAGQLLEPLARWVGGVHELAETSRDAGNPDPHRATDVDRLCAGGTATLANAMVRLHRVTEQSLLRLGRLALAAVSEADRRECWTVLVTAIAADQAMGGPRSGLLAWICVSSRQPLDDLVAVTVDALLADGDPVCLRSVERLITWTGSPALLPRLAALPPEASLPKPPFQDEYEADPCNCFFRAPPRELLPACLERSDVPLRFNITRAGRLAADRDFNMPSVFVDRVVQQAQALDVERLHWHISQDDVDHSWSELEPVLCRAQPQVFADLIRKFARSAQSREGVPLRQLSWTVVDHVDLLTQDDVAALVAAWKRVAPSVACAPNEADFAEAMLSKSILVHRDSAVEQWKWLLQRPSGSGELLSIADEFMPMSLDDQARHLRVSASDSRLLRLALWFLSAQRHIHIDTARHLIGGALLGQDSGARGLALLVLQRIDPAEWPALPVLGFAGGGDPAWAIEQFYGTLTLMRVEGPSADALRRCSLAYVAACLPALDEADRNAWAEFYGKTLLTSLAHRLCGSDAAASHPNLDLETGKAKQPWQRISLSRPPSASVTYVAPMSTWGGLRPDPGGESFRSLENVDAAHDERSRALDAALQAAATSGDWLFVTDIPVQSIGAIVAAMGQFPGELDILIRQARSTGRLSLLQPALEPATAWALSNGYPWGALWYDLLEQVDMPVRHVDRRFGLLQRRVALLSAPRQPTITTRWMRLLQRATCDHELFSILYVLVCKGHGAWVKEEALSQLRSQAPYGLALGISMLASLDDDGQTLRQATVDLNVPGSSWPGQLLGFAWRYRQRGNDLRHWLLRAVEAVDPVDRVAAARLALAIEDHRAADILFEIRHDATRSPEQRARAWRIRIHSDNNRRSDWAKQLDTHLFGRRRHEHAAAPWLP